MTRAEWDDSATLTDSEKLERRLKAAVTTIRRDWPEILRGPSNPKQRIGGGGRASGILGAHGPADRTSTTGSKSWSADHEATGADIDGTTRLMALVRFVQDVLAETCDRIVHDRRITNPATVPYRTDVIAMCRFIETHAQWLTGQDHDEVEDVAVDLEDLARDVHGVVDPFKRTHHFLGPCPFVIAGDPEGGHVGQFCRGRIEAPLYDSTEASCSNTDHTDSTATTEWWEEVLGHRKGLDKPVTIPQLVPILAERLHVTVTDRQVRNWARDGKITPYIAFGPQPLHRVFIPRTVLDDLTRMDKECANCGRIWNGLGEFCLSCYEIAKGRKVSRATDKPPFSVVRVPPPPSLNSAPRHPDEDDRCPLHELPRAWCYRRSTAG